MSTPFDLRLSSQLHAEIVAHARAESPLECCGLLAGVGRDALARYPLVNAAASPVRYDAEPRSLFAAFKAMRQAGHDLVAIYHSHPTADPIPSRTDLAHNGYGNEVVHLIVAPTTGVIRGWFLDETSFREAVVAVVAA